MGKIEVGTPVVWEGKVCGVVRVSPCGMMLTIIPVDTPKPFSLCDLVSCFTEEVKLYDND